MEKKSFFEITNSQFISCSSIYVELYFILSSIWKYKMYCVWIYLFLSAILLFIIVSCLTSIILYFRLNAENYKWQWVSFLGPFGIFFFVFGYCIVFYVQKLYHDGTLQLIYYLSFSFELSLIIGAMCGFIGFFASNYFVRFLFRTLKVD